MALSQLPLAVSLPDDELFSSYIGSTNRKVVTELTEYLTRQRPAIPGFYLFGQKSTGKSHLLHASCSFIAQQQGSSLCLSCNELAQLPVSVVDGLETLDLICIDDIQLFANDLVWQQAIFDLYNRVLETGKKIVISGNNTVEMLQLTLPDLSSRLSWGQVAQLKMLTDEEKVQAIQYRAYQRGLVLNDDVARFLLNRLTRDMTSLIMALERLDKASIQEKRKITIPFVKQCLFDNQPS